MKYLIDTCIISELIKKNPNRKVIEWVSSLDINDIGISVLTFGEIFKGIQKQKDDTKKKICSIGLQMM